MKQLLLISCLLVSCCVSVPNSWAQSRPVYPVSDISRVAENIGQAQQAVEDAASRAGLQRATGTSSAKQDRQVRSNAHELDGQLDSLAGVLKDIERSLARTGRHDLLERHRERTAELEQRLEQIRGSLVPGELDRLSETGLPFGRVFMQREREERIYNRDDDPIKKNKTSPGTLLGPVVEPLRRAPREPFDPNAGEAFRPSGKAFALAQGKGVFRLVSFERDKSFENTAPVADSVHGAVRFDLDLPLGARPLLVAGLGPLQGLISQAVLQAISLPAEQDSEPDGRSVIITPEIAALAEELGKNPVRIYEYVKNTTMYQPYWGALKGAAETLAQKSGNDADQASLLIALLRASGYPARYGRALVTVDIERAKQWLGVEDDTCVDWMLATAGVPGTTALVDQDRQRSGPCALSIFLWKPICPMPITAAQPRVHATNSGCRWRRPSRSVSMLPGWTSPSWSISTLMRLPTILRQACRETLMVSTQGLTPYICRRKLQNLFAVCATIL